MATNETTQDQENNETIRNTLEALAQEMDRSFDNWDKAIKNKQQPVTIQDLDFWRTVIRTQISMLEVRA